LSVGGHEATFTVDTFREHIRVSDFLGERVLIGSILKDIQSDDVFWDVGANIGTHACLAGKKAEAVVAVEARPETYEKLQSNLEQNDISFDCFNCALAASDGVVELALPPTAAPAVGVGSYSMARTETGSNTISVDAISGDTLVGDRGIPKPTVVKLDVEGAEESVLDGMTTALSDCRLLFCEVHTDLVELRTVEEKIRNCGFETLQRVSEHGDQIHLRAE